MVPGDFKITQDSICLVAGFQVCPPLPSGFLIDLWVNGREVALPTTREVFDLQFSPLYNPYPCLGEFFFSPVFDSEGTVVGLLDRNRIFDGHSPIKTGVSLGTYAMFKQQIGPETPAIGNLLRIEGDAIVFDGLDAARQAGLLTNCQWRGAIPEPHDGVAYQIAPDADVYTWDWTVSSEPFGRCSWEEARRRGYPTRFELGELADVTRGCYWFSAYATREDGPVLDMVNIFLNEAPGWV